jgi:pimeloyl-ACP methyl ester carboxylesterase
MLYHDEGTGEALVLLHGGGLADWLAPVADSPALAGLRRIRITRSGYRDAPTAATVAEHAAEHAALLRELGVGPVRVLAHSVGCVFALQLALDHPDLVSELLLVEPPLIDPLLDPADREAVAALLGPALGAAVGAAMGGDLATAFDLAMSALCGPEYRAAMVAAFGAEGLERAVGESRWLFMGEVPAMNGWTVDPGAITQPVRLIAGGDSPEFTHRLVRHLAGELPQATVTTVPGVNHLMPLTATEALADLAAPVRC